MVDKARSFATIELSPPEMSKSTTWLFPTSASMFCGVISLKSSLAKIGTQFLSDEL